METTTTSTAAATAVATRDGSWATQTIGERTFSVAIFTLSTAVTVAFAYYLFSDPSRLSDVWAWVRSLPIIVQLAIWLLCLPWMIALWVWTLPLAFAIRLVLVLAILAFTEYLMYPIK